MKKGSWAVRVRIRSEEAGGGRPQPRQALRNRPMWSSHENVGEGDGVGETVLNSSMVAAQLMTRGWAAIAALTPGTKKGCFHSGKEAGDRDGAT